jgi:hypothetical protein
MGRGKSLLVVPFERLQLDSLGVTNMKVKNFGHPNILEAKMHPALGLGEPTLIPNDV